MEKFKLTLENKCIQYKENEGYIEFEYLSFKCSINSLNQIFLDRNLYKRFPHVMEDGLLCTSGNSSITLQESDIDYLEMAIDYYLPWLFSMDSHDKVIEILNEIEYYLVKDGYKVKIDKSKPFESEECGISSTYNLWERLADLEQNKWYKLFSLHSKDTFIYVKFCTRNGEVRIYLDDIKKSSQRILGINYEEVNKSAAFIGMGSVNSYISKLLLAHNIRKIVAIDDKKVNIGNLFRFAYPFLNIYKVDALRKFAKSFDREIKVINKRIKVDSSTHNHIENIEYIFISVDLPFSWLDALAYVIKFMNTNSTLILVGIDAFGNYGKYLFIKLDKPKEYVIKKSIEFLTFKDTRFSRKSMIGNGCGNSLAIYNESSLIKLAQTVVNTLVSKEYSSEVEVIEL